MILISSAAFVNADLRAEFGLIPPAFLPLGNKRLYQHQIKKIKTIFPNEKIIISLPSEYQLPKFDEHLLDSNNITIVRTPHNISLGKSIYLIIDKLSLNHNDRLLINYGDSFFSTLEESKKDSFIVSRNIGYYNRSLVTEKHNRIYFQQDDSVVDDGELVISGFFYFYSLEKLKGSLLEANFNFLLAIENYFNINPYNIIESKEWHDFGHLNSFFISRTSITTEREFNNLAIDTDKVVKRSKKKLKMKAEANWFKNIPPNLSLFTPRFFSYKENNDFSEYEIEYLYNLPLSDMAVFCELPTSIWMKVFLSCFNFIGQAKKLTLADSFDINLSDYDSLYHQKTISRLAEFSKKSDLCLDRQITYNGILSPSINSLAEETAKYIYPTTLDDITISHGDFCFSNILYNYRAQRIQLIDPRGIDANNKICLYGDMRYDLAKLNHSAIGRYDLIISQRYNINFDLDSYCIDFELFDDNYQIIEESFKSVYREHSLIQYTQKEINAITIHLFLSMLPLHSDSYDRQLAFIANAYRLYNLFKDMG